MDKATIEAKRAYNRENQRKWRDKNKEKARVYQRQYMQKYRKENAERLKANSGAFYRRLAEKGQVND
ncbi:hypothetical protein KQI46_15710 [Lysinibacillus capsici]|uniref:hypothetical protein n=1 Tax=Lysinibacillus capsici TaxID=2115968 RepID=UPI001C104E85|nr:hypothetical protein [Lysinibacillus capsici]MBU5253334.1 hypothetical protein [Lysinibacillus capsici]